MSLLLLRLLCLFSLSSTSLALFPVKVSWLLQKSWWKILAQTPHCGSWWPVGGCRPTDVARNSSAGAPTGGPRWSGGQVVPPPSIQLPGGVFGSSGGTMGRHCSAVVKGHMLRMGGGIEGAPAYNSSKSSSCFSSACFRTKRLAGQPVSETQQENPWRC